MRGLMYFSPLEVELLEEVSTTTAYRRLSKIRRSFGIESYGKVSIAHYAEFRKLDVEVVISLLEKAIARWKAKLGK